MANEITAEFLCKQLTASRNREKAFRKKGRECSEIYEEKEPEAIPFNILYSNTETLAPALYNTTPRPQVTRRFKDPDPMAASASLFGKRALEYLIDNGYQNYETFDDVMKGIVLDSLVPGRGIPRVKYHADIERDDEGNPVKLNSEMVCVERWQWDRFLMGYAQKWIDVPWIAYEHCMTKQDLVDNFGKEKAELIEIKSAPETDDDDREAIPQEDRLSDAEAVTKVHEVWHKASRKIYWVSEDNTTVILREDEDPYQLVNFFDCPDQLKLFRRIKSLIPRQLYDFYRQQARELNDITRRMTSIVKQIRVRGCYDSTLGETLKKILSEDEDGAFVPAQNPAMMEMGSFEKAIWFLPIEKLAATYVQLAQQRQAVKQVIYEITGVSDILRGASVASETATAQEIKNQWGTLRLKRSQRLVSITARDILRIMLELAMTKLSESTLKQMTGLPFPTTEEKQQAVAQVQAMQQQMQLAQQMGVPPQQPNPEFEKIQKAASSPSMGELQALLADDKQRSYRVDIETNSTVDAEATEDKQDISELLNAIAQFMNGVAPMIEKGVMPFEAAKAMLMTIVRRYNFGPELESALEMMKAPQQQGNPEQQKQMEQQQKMLQQEQQKLMQERQALELQKQQAKMEMDAQRQALEMEKTFAIREIQQAAKFATKDQQLAIKSAEQSAANKIEGMLTKAAAQREGEEDGLHTES